MPNQSLSTSSTTTVCSPLTTEATLPPTNLPTADAIIAAGTAMRAAATSTTPATSHGHFFFLGGVQLLACCQVT